MRGSARALRSALFGFFMPPLRLHPVARIWEQMRAGQGQGGVSLVPRGAARKGEMARCALTRAALAAGEEPGCSVE
jgi:hypothetical protein